MDKRQRAQIVYPVIPPPWATVAAPATHETPGAAGVAEGGGEMKPGSIGAGQIVVAAEPHQKHLRSGETARTTSPLSVDPDTAPGHTDLMVSPEAIDEFLDKNPLPDDPQPTDAPRTPEPVVFTREMADLLREVAEWAGCQAPH